MTSENRNAVISIQIHSCGRKNANQRYSNSAANRLNAAALKPSARIVLTRISRSTSGIPILCRAWTSLRTSLTAFYVLAGAM